MMLETRKKFHEELDDLETALQRLGELAAGSVHEAVAALIENDPARSEKVIDDDDTIDELYLEIDQGVLALLALQAPVASDLRLVSALMHCCLHLERIGDQAVNVAKLHLATVDPHGVPQSMAVWVGPGRTMEARTPLPSNSIRICRPIASRPVLDAL